MTFTANGRHDHVTIFPPVFTFAVYRFQRKEERFHVREKRGENVCKNYIFYRCGTLAIIYFKIRLFYFIL